MAGITINAITGNGPWTVTGKSGANYKIYSNGQVEKQSSESPQSLSNLEPGVYDENDEMVMDWDEFLGVGFWSGDSNGVLPMDFTPVYSGTMTEETAMGYLSS